MTIHFVSSTGWRNAHAHCRDHFQWPTSGARKNSSNRMELQWVLAPVVWRRDKINRDFRRVGVAENMERPLPAAVEQIHGRSTEAVEAGRSEVQIDTFDRRPRRNIINGQLAIAGIGRVEPLAVGGKLQSGRRGTP